MAAVLAARPSVASHESGACLWGLLRYRPSTIDVTVPSERRQGRPFRLHFAALDRTEIGSPQGVPATSVARTKLDLAARLPQARLEGVFERSEELQLFDLGPLEAVLARTPHHPGAGTLKRVLALYRPEAAVTRSWLERRFLELVRKAGLPLPAMNYVVGGMELDAYWAAERFAVELDVFETHGTRVAFERDRIRADDLLALGIEVIRITGPRLRREPEQVMRRLADHLARRRAISELGTRVPGLHS